MKVLFVVACALAIASAGYSYHGPEHHPIIYKGVPVDTPEVQHARAAHLEALEKASHGGYHYDEYQHDDNHNEHHGHSEHYGYSVKHVSHHHHHETPVHHAPIQHHTEPAYHTSHAHPAIGHDGKPLDTPKVEEAKANHFAAVHKALSQAPSHDDYYHFRQRRSVHSIHIPIIDKHGVPVEPLEVQHARAEHLAHHASADHSGYGHHEDYSHEEEHYTHPQSHEGHADLHDSKHGYTLHQKHAPVYGHHHDHYIPKYDYHGLPLDTEEVEHLKAKHFAAHAEALHHY